MTDTCVCCGAPVPEGRMVCGACEQLESKKAKEKEQMDLQDLNIAVAEIRGCVDRNTGRIKDLEKRNDAVSKLASSVAVMAEHMKTMDEKIDEMQSSVSELTAKPGKRWDTIVMSVVMAIVAGLVGWALARAGLGG